jgi:hypothetical protein
MTVQRAALRAVKTRRDRKGKAKACFAQDLISLRVNFV